MNTDKKKIASLSGFNHRVRDQPLIFIRVHLWF